MTSCVLEEELQSFNPRLRTFETGATRDIATGKLEYSNYINPLADYNYAEYMKGKQYIGWEYRKGNNWQKWIPDESLFESLVRHMEIVKLIRAWYRVWECKKDWVVSWVVHKDDKWTGEYDTVEEKNIIDELNAMRFNSEALKLYYLKQQ